MTVTFEILEPHIGLLLVNRPQARNALRLVDMETFSQCAEQAVRTADLHALIVAGAGEAFIAGGDLKELHKYPNYSDAERLSQGMTAALDMFETLPCPVIAAINGPARGGGVEVALACDLRVMSENATLGMAQITLGLAPGWGGGLRLLRLVGYSRAFDLLTTGRVIGTTECLALGLANRSAPPGSALPAAIELARLLSGQSQPAVRAVKRILRASLTLPPDQVRQIEQKEFLALWVSDEHLQAVESFLHAKRGA